MELSYKHLINLNWYMSKCCVCGEVQGYKDAGKELKDGDQVVSHTYCVDCAEKLLTDVEDDYCDVDY